MTILVCGEALYDFFQTAEPEPGALSFEARVGGSPFNVAIGIARQNGKAALLTGVSRDLLGQRLFNRLEAEQVDTRFLLRSGRRTTLSIVGLDRDGHPDYAFYGVGSADVALTPEDMPDLSDEISALHFGSYSIAVAPAADAFASLAERNRDRFISLDPNVRPTVEGDMAVWRARVDALRQFSDLIKVSAEDLGMMFPGEAPADIARRWQSDGTALVVVTDGGRDAVAYAAGQEVRVPARTVDLVDTVGAGDAFQATLLRNLQDRGVFAADRTWVEQVDLESLLRDSVKASAIVCGRQGADMPRRDEI